jgi:outer membrane lipoprotein carrier protein
MVANIEDSTPIANRGRNKRNRTPIALAASGAILLIGLAIPYGQSWAAPAASGKQPSQNTPDLSTIINALQNKYSRMKGLAADFVQVYQGPDGQVQRESGRVLLRKPDKARWEYYHPERKLFISTGKDIYFYVLGDRYASRAKVKESVDPQIPFLFLLGRGNLRRDFSRIELVTNDAGVRPENYLLRLVPKRAPEEFKRLLVEIVPSSFEVRRLVIFEQSGGRMDFTLSNVRENFIAADSEFSFVAPPGVVIKQQ